MGGHHGCRAQTLDRCPALTVSPRLRPIARGALITVMLAVFRLPAAAADRLLCDGVRDVSNELQSALDAVHPGDTLTLPVGTCRTSRALRLQGKQRVVVQGAADARGRRATTLRVSDPRNGALMVMGGEDITVRRLHIESAAIARGSQPVEHGLHAADAHTLHIEDIEVVGVAGAGIHLCGVDDAVVRHVRVRDSRGDGVHVSCGSRNVTLVGNTVSGSGDDCFASVGYGIVRNHDITIRDNVCEGGAASGVTIGGTSGAIVRANRLVRTGAAGIRVESEQHWSTERADDVLIEANVLVGVRQRADIGHPALLVYSNLGALTDVRLRNNIIEAPATHMAVQLYATAPGTLAGVEVTGTRVTSRERRGTQGLGRGDGASTPAQVITQDNTLDRVRCP